MSDMVKTTILKIPALSADLLRACASGTKQTGHPRRGGAEGSPITNTPVHYTFAFIWIHIKCAYIRVYIKTNK